MASLDTFVCRRCEQPPVALVSVAELDDGRAAGPPLAEVALCGEHLAEVAAVLGEGPAAARPTRQRGAAQPCAAGTRSRVALCKAGLLNSFESDNTKCRHPTQNS